MKKKEKTINNPIFGNFKLGDKVWYIEPVKPFNVKVPGIIMKDRIESVGEQRNEYVRQGTSPYIPFSDIPEDYVKSRRKTFPAERERLRLSKLGLEEEYVRTMHPTSSNLTQRELELLDLVKTEGFDYGAYIEWYTDKGFTRKEIEDLVKKGVLKLQDANFSGRVIVCPFNKTYR